MNRGSGEGGHRPPVEKLGAYALGDLPVEERAELEAHLLGCPACRAELEGLWPVAALLGKADPNRLGEESLVGSPPGLAERVYERVERERRREARRRPPARVGWLAAAAVVLVVLAISGLFVAQGSGEQVSLRPVSERTELPAALQDCQADATLEGGRYSTQIELEAGGLVPGQAYEVWLERADGTRVSAGGFQAYDEGPITVRLSAALPPDEAVALGLGTPEGETGLRAALQGNDDEDLIVPDLRGKTLEEAVGAAGPDFEVDTQGNDGGTSDEKVVDQDPGPGERARKGATVSVTLGDGGQASEEQEERPQSDSSEEESSEEAPSASSEPDQSSNAETASDAASPSDAAPTSGMVSPSGEIPAGGSIDAGGTEPAGETTGQNSPSGSGAAAGTAAIPAASGSASGPPVVRAAQIGGEGAPEASPGVPAAPNGDTGANTGEDAGSPNNPASTAALPGAGPEPNPYSPGASSTPETAPGVASLPEAAPVLPEAPFSPEIAPSLPEASLPAEAAPSLPEAPLPADVAPSLPQAPLPEVAQLPGGLSPSVPSLVPSVPDALQGDQPALPTPPEVPTAPGLLQGPVRDALSGPLRDSTPVSGSTPPLTGPNGPLGNGNDPTKGIPNIGGGGKNDRPNLGNLPTRGAPGVGGGKGKNDRPNLNLPKKGAPGAGGGGGKGNAGPKLPRLLR